MQLVPPCRLETVSVPVRHVEPTLWSLNMTHDMAYHVFLDIIVVGAQFGVFCCMVGYRLCLV